MAGQPINLSSDDATQNDHANHAATTNLAKIIEDVKKQTNQLSNAQIPPLLKFFAVVLLIGRFLSCGYRFTTTDDSLDSFFNRFHLSFKGLWELKETAAFIFYLSDALITLARSSPKVIELPNIHRVVLGHIKALRPTDGDQYPPAKFLPLVFSLFVAAYGSFLKGRVGLKSVAELLAGENATETARNIIESLSYFAGISSAMCSLAFQSQEAFLTVRTRFALRNQKEDMDVYFRSNRRAIISGHFANAIVSFSMMMITIMAVFYNNDKSGKLNFTPSAIVQSILLAIGNIILNAIYTTGPNYIYNDILEKNKKITQVNQPDSREKETKLSFFAQTLSFAGKTIGFTSSLGNSVAVFSPIIHLILKLSESEEKFSEKDYAWGGIGTGLTLFLGYFMFQLDYTFYAKKLLQSVAEWDKNRIPRDEQGISQSLLSHSVNSNQDQERLPMAFSCCFPFSGSIKNFFRRDPQNLPGFQV